MMMNSKKKLKIKKKNKIEKKKIMPNPLIPCILMLLAFSKIHTQDFNKFRLWASR